MVHPLCVSHHVGFMRALVCMTYLRSSTGSSPLAHWIGERIPSPSLGSMPMAAKDSTSKIVLVDPESSAVVLMLSCWAAQKTSKRQTRHVLLSVLCIAAKQFFDPWLGWKTLLLDSSALQRTEHSVSSVLFE